MSIKPKRKKKNSKLKDRWETRENICNIDNIQKINIFTYLKTSYQQGKEALQ